MSEEIIREELAAEEIIEETVEAAADEAPKANLDDKKRNALLRYVAILFAVAFVLVLVSLLGQMRHSMSTITQLNESSTSAMQKVELLQQDNQALTEANEALQAELDEMKRELADTQAIARKEVYKAKTATDDAKADAAAKVAAYESLLTSMEEGAEVVEIEGYEKLFGAAGKAAYEALFANEGE